MYVRRPVRVSRPSSLVFDLAQPLRMTMPPQSGIAAVVPRRLLAEGTEDVGPRHGQALPGASVPLARRLAAHPCHLADALATATATPAQVGDLVPATLALCRAIVRSGRGQSAACQDDEAGGGRTELAEEVRRYIDTHLVTVDLATLIRRFGLSRRPLYRLFAETGGVESFIRERRLAHARRVLAVLSRRPKLARLAHACGFADPQVFSRAFKRQYGLSPMQLDPSPPPRRWRRASPRPGGRAGPHPRTGRHRDRRTSMPAIRQAILDHLSRPPPRRRPYCDAAFNQP